MNIDKLLEFYLDQRKASLKVINKLAVSLGGVETLIELPYLMTHDNAQETAASAPVDLIRVSVGLENIEDLIDDMDSALNAAKK